MRFGLRLLLLNLTLGIASLTSAQTGNVYEIDAKLLKDNPVSNCFTFKGTSPDGTTLSVNSQYLTRNGLPWLPVMGEFHYTRYPHQYWEEEIRKMKSAGIEIVATYVFWETHENPRGQWNWSGDCDLKRFIELCRKNNMYVWLRIGPYCNAELLNGGLPAWIASMKGRRTNDPDYLRESRRYYQQVASQVNGMFFNEGGPIIGVQVENEYANGQPDHPDSLKQMALSLGMNPVYFSLTANSVFHDDKFGFLPLQGSYPYRGWEKGGGGPTQDFLYGKDQWILNSAFGGRLYYDPEKYPRGLCEQGCGSQMELWNRFTVDPAIVEAHLQNQIGRGMNLIGYYMFQGGTQTPGQKRAGYPESYDFQAPLSEFGEVRDSYRYLKILHHFLNDFGSDLAPMQMVRPANPVSDVTDTRNLRYIARMKDSSGFLFVNNAQVRIPMPDKSFRIRLKLKRETIEFPRKEMVLKGETTAILPFNLNVNGVNLKYATAQPLARFVNDSTEYLFLMQIPGMHTELAVEAASLKSSNAKGWTIERSNGISYYTPVSGREIELTAANGKRSVVVLLTRSEAENSWRTSVDGHELLLISNADLSWYNSTIQMNQLNSNNFELKVIPNLPKPLVANGTKVRFVPDGLFSVAKLSVPRVNVNLLISKKSKAEAEIKLPAALPKGLNDIFLKIDYLGGNADIRRDGKVLNDHLYHGPAWMVGIKRYLNGSSRIILKAYKWDDRINGIPKKDIDRIKKDGPALEKISPLAQYSLKLEW